MVGSSAVKNPPRLATFWQTIHHQDMHLRILLVSILLTASAWAGIVDDVRLALMQNNFSAAESALNSYRNQQGVTAEYLDAYSWMGRAALDQGQYDQAAAYAKQTRDAGAGAVEEASAGCRSAPAGRAGRGAGS